VHKKNLAATTQKVILQHAIFRISHEGQDLPWLLKHAKSPCARKCCGKIACAKFWISKGYI